MLERYPEQRLAPWASVRRELRAMSRVVPLMYADLGAPPAPVYFAADAMGSNEIDHGGFGIVGKVVSEKTIKECYIASKQKGFTVARHAGGWGGGGQKPSRREGCNTPAY